MKRKCMFAASLLMAAVILFGCGKPAEQEQAAVAAVPAMTNKAREGIQTLLVMSLEETQSGSVQNGSRADLIMLMVIDEKLGKTTALQLNPDTVVSFTEPGKSEAKDIPLGEIYTYGSGGSDSCLNQKKAVSTLVGGVPIDHYMTFTIESIGIVNDMVGGVTVTVSEDFPKDYPELVKGEEVTLAGDNAVAFFSYRSDSDVSNEVHMGQQQQYMTGMFPLFVAAAKDDNFLTKLSMKVGDGLSTDLTLSQMVQMLDSIGKYQLDKNVLTVSGKAEKTEEGFRFQVDQDALTKMVEGLLF